MRCSKAIANYAMLAGVIPATEGVVNSPHADRSSPFGKDTLQHLMATIFLTGATGFLGSHLARAFLQDHHRIEALRRANSSLIRLEDIKDQILWHVVEPSQHLDANLFRDVDVVVHAAGMYGRSGESSLDVAGTNLLFSLDVLENAISAGVETFIYTGTGLPASVSPYALSKNQLSQWGHLLSRRTDTRFVNIQLEHVYGPGDDNAKFVDWVIDCCLRNLPEIKLTEGYQRRDFIYVSDVASAFCALLRTTVVGEHKYVDVPLGSGQDVSIRELVTLVHRLTQSKTKLSFGGVEMRDGDAPYVPADLSVIKSTGWSPQVCLQEGLMQTVESKRT